MSNSVTQTLSEKNQLLNQLNLYYQQQEVIEVSSWETSVEIHNDNSRFFRITELSAQEQFALRQDLENVIACIKDSNYTLAYYLSGTKTGIEIYIGVVLIGKGDIVSYSQLLGGQLVGNISGIVIDDVRANSLQQHILQPLQNSNHFGLVTGVPSLTLDQQAHSKGESISQGLDRLATSLNGEVWQMLIIAQPVDNVAINQQLETLLSLSTEFHPLVKQSLQHGENNSKSTTSTKGESKSYGITEQDGTNTSFTKSDGKNDGGSKSKSKGTSTSNGSNKSSNGSSSSSGTNESKGTNEGTSETITWGTNTGTSETKGTNYSKSISSNDSTSTSTASGETVGANTSQSIEVLDKKLQHIAKYIDETQIKRFEMGRSKGLFQTAVYLASPNAVVYQRLSSAITTIFQGNQVLFSPLQVRKLNFTNKNIHQLFQIHWKKPDIHENIALLHSIPVYQQKQTFATLLNANELSLLAGLPSREVCGIRLRKNVDFAVNTVQTNHQDNFELGHIIQNGRKLEHAKVYLNKKLLNQHIFISGVTGAGKTTTCQQILLESKLPFLVIEPAKTEYRSLYQLDNSIQYYTVNNEKLSPFRLNPFELLPNEQLLGHIDMLKATFSAVFPMEASMPYLIEEAIVRSYELKGWDINTSTNFIYENPYDHPEQCFPIMSELLQILKDVIKSKNFGQELQEKYEGSLISRLDNLTVGSKGKMLNTRVSIDINQLLDQKVVIELEELKDEQDKALLMGLLIGRVAEAVKQRHKKDVNFQHITLIEEAHRLLEKPEGEDKAKRLGVNLFSNLLAEVRKYGECLIIADQIPNKLTPEVLKNTNTKIIHRLFAGDDREVIGETVGLNDEQKQFLPMLQAGEAVVYSAGWHEAVRMQVKQINNTNAPEIDETIIKNISQQQIFSQREKLYRHLSAISHQLNASEFSDFVQQGTLILNLWLRWSKIQLNQGNTFIEKIKPQLPMICQRLQHEMINFVETWQTKVDNVLVALAKLFLDIAPLSFVEYEKSADYRLDICLVKMFELYQQDLQQEMVDDSIFGMQGGRKIIKILQANLNEMDSL